MKITIDKSNIILCKHCGKDVRSESLYASFLNAKKICLACCRKELKEKFYKSLKNIGEIKNES